MSHNSHNSPSVQVDSASPSNQKIENPTFFTLKFLPNLKENQISELRKSEARLEKADLPQLWITIIYLLACNIASVFVFIENPTSGSDTNTTVCDNYLNEHKKKILTISAISICIYALIFLIVRAATFTFLSSNVIIDIFGRNNVVSDGAIACYSFMIVFGLLGVSLTYPAISYGQDGDNDSVIYTIVAAVSFLIGTGFNRAYHHLLITNAHDSTSVSELLE
jgi:hypothetical protein